MLPLNISFDQSCMFVFFIYTFSGGLGEQWKLGMLVFFLVSVETIKLI